MNFTQNNLSTAVSPYLRQHKNNPVWWQEWNNEVLAHAKQKNKLIFVSVGYSTCHWCHVMAREAFSNKTIAAYLNEHFVCIKVDREQRADIDQYLMSFLQQTTGRGGWPLNVFLTPDLKPLFGLTYAPVEPRFGLPSFIDSLRKIKEFYAAQAKNVQAFTPMTSKTLSSTEQELIDSSWNEFDKENGGFGTSTKFPSHCTLLFMLYYVEATQDKKLKRMLEQTLEVMFLRGLHDHLQGGFFRYCVDAAWTIPHFEKMLYDQAMLLWIYAIAYKVLAKKEHKTVAQRILVCLRDNFEDDGLFFSAHNADTDHEEGKTYIWSEEELKNCLTTKEYRQFTKGYLISKKGNFEGKTHLIKKKAIFLPRIEKKLLALRKKRAQPFVDKKILTSWNCLAGIGLIHAHRYLGTKKELQHAEALFEKLVKKNYSNKRLAHSSYEGVIQHEEFLQDYASMLLFITYLHEETGMYEHYLKEFYEKMLSFKKEGVWIESQNTDFIALPAESYDHPIPSSISLAEFAIVRMKILLNQEYAFGTFKQALSSDFSNIATLLANGFFHVIETPKKLAWTKLGANTVQLKGKKVKECYKGVCYDRTQ